MNSIILSFLGFLTFGYKLLCLLPCNLIVILLTTPGVIVQFINDSPRVIRGENHNVKVEIDLKLSEAVSRAECKFGPRRIVDCKYLCVHITESHGMSYMLCIKLAY